MSAPEQLTLCEAQVRLFETNPKQADLELRAAQLIPDTVYYSVSIYPPGTRGTVWPDQRRKRVVTAHKISKSDQKI